MNGKHCKLLNESLYMYLFIISCSQLPCSIQAVRQHLKEIEVIISSVKTCTVRLSSLINMFHVYMHNAYALLQPNLRSVCESLHVSGSSGPCHWINTAKKLGVQLSEAQIKQQCSHLFPIDSCIPLVSCIMADSIYNDNISYKYYR